MDDRHKYGEVHCDAKVLSTSPPINSHQQRCENVLRVVAQYFGLRMIDLLATTRRESKVAFARQIAMYLAHTHYSIPMGHIGETIGRDRTTVGFGIRKIEDRRDETDIDVILSCLEMALPHVGANGVHETGGTECSADGDHHGAA